MKLSPNDLGQICQLVNDVAGIQWDESKTYLIESRLPNLLQTYHCRDLGELVAKVKSGDPVIREAFVDAITTRETLFFRDETPFEAMKNKALPEILDAKAKLNDRRLRIWSAACSSGQEPYSIAIVLNEMLDESDGIDVQIMATDISSAALATASKGVYSEFEMSRGVPKALRDKYFKQVANGWKICDEIRSMVSFSQRNLLQPFKAFGIFDIIFCRNVAIYFDLPVKVDLFERLSQVLAPHGAIFVGGSENLAAYGPKWKPYHHCRGTFYQPNRQVPPPIATKDIAKPTYSTPVSSTLNPAFTVKKPVITNVSAGVPAKTVNSLLGGGMPAPSASTSRVAAPVVAGAAAAKPVLSSAVPKPAMLTKPAVVSAPGVVAKSVAVASVKTGVPAPVNAVSSTIIAAKPSSMPVTSGLPGTVKAVVKPLIPPATIRK